MKIKGLFSLLTGLLLLSCNGQSKKFESVSPETFSEKIKTTPNAQILDVRTPAEFSGQHLDNAVNVNWNGPDFVSKVSIYDKQKPVFVYCMAGGRSKEAAAKLNELGFTNVYELNGGIMKWNAAGLSNAPEKIIGMCSQEYKEMLAKDKKVLVNFYAEWCAPCKKMAPYMTKLQETEKDLKIIRLNADEHKTLISEMNISELPTLLLYESGKVKWKHSGFISEDDLKKQL